MIAINNKAFENDRGVIFAYLDDSRVPQQAWTSARVGKISGRLAGGKPLNGGLPGLPNREFKAQSKLKVQTSFIFNARNFFFPLDFRPNG